MHGDLQFLMGESIIFLQKAPGNTEGSTDTLKYVLSEFL